MTEQIITKNLYSILASGGVDANTAYANLMPTTLSRFNMGTSNTVLENFHKPKVSDIPTNYILYPVNYSKSLSEMTESELYSHETNIVPTSKQCYGIPNASTGLTSGIKWVSTYTNTSNKNVTINGVKLVLEHTANNTLRYFNLIHTKFDAAITVPPTESYSFTLDLDNIFTTFPSTLGS